MNLPCPVRGTPTPRVTWYKDGREISGGEEGIRVNQDGSLEIERALASHAGTYECEADNVAGRDSHTIDVDVLCKYCINYLCVCINCNLCINIPFRENYPPLFDNKNGNKLGCYIYFTFCGDP